MKKLAICFLLVGFVQALAGQQPEYIPNSTYKYGRVCNCSYVPSGPEYRDKLWHLLKASDTTTLKTWLYSEYKELNAYAVEGYITLQKKGIVITGDIIKKIEQVKKDKALIYTCSTCTNRIMPLNKALRKGLKAARKDYMTKYLN